MMRLIARFVGAVMLTVVLPGVLWARQVPVVDLSTAKADTVKVSTGEYRVQVRNGLIGYAYALTERGRQKAATAPISLPKATGGPLSSGKPCAVETWRLAFASVQTERAVPEFVAAADDAIAKASPACTREERASLALLFDPIREGRELEGSVKIGPGETVLVAVLRIADTLRTTVKEIVLVSTDDGPQPFFSFGVLHRFGKQERFRARESTAGKYTVEGGQNDALDPTALVAITFPASWKNLRISAFVPITLGESAFAGWGAGLSFGNSWMQLHYGGVLGNTRRLRPEYRGTSKEISEQLTEEQLTQSAYRFMHALGMSLRLSSNPFKKEEPKSAEPKKDDQAKPSAPMPPSSPH
ncbi:hypothetical protein [Gemmatimonas sp.]|uniref:hypothetical protein n=1 Tax=Gemmatimonas sp. TaxID=1962908 RepID=UPI003F6E5B33